MRALKKETLSLIILIIYKNQGPEGVTDYSVIPSGMSYVSPVSGAPDYVLIAYSGVDFINYIKGGKQIQSQ